MQNIKGVHIYMKRAECVDTNEKSIVRFLMKNTEIATLLKSVLFPNYQRYLSQILIAEIEDLNKDCVKTSRPSMSAA